MSKPVKTINEIQNEIIVEFSSLNDPFAEYELLLSLSAQFKRLEDSQKAAATLVQGCQSQVWLLLDAQNEALLIEADSDTLIIRGILSLIKRALQGQKCTDVASCDIYFLKEAELTATFEKSRQEGIEKILEEIREFARSKSRRND